MREVAQKNSYNTNTVAEKGWQAMPKTGKPVWKNVSGEGGVNEKTEPLTNGGRMEWSAGDGAARPQPYYTEFLKKKMYLFKKGGLRAGTGGECR